MNKSRPLVFVLLKPDVFYRNLLSDLLSYLESHHFYVIEFFSGRVNESHYHLMYSHSFCWDVDDWNHNRRLFDFGPALGLVLHSDQSIDAIHYLNEVKGSALPKERKLESLRALFQSKSRIFNLFHVPNGAEQAKKEGMHWFDWKKWKESSQVISKEVVIEEMQMCGYCHFEVLDPEYVFIRAKLRLFHSFKKRGNSSEKIREYLCQMQSFYSLWASEVQKTSSCNGIEGTILPLFQEKERSVLLRLREQIPNSIHKLRQSVSILSELSAYPNLWNNFFWILDEWNVFLCDLEKYLIICRLKYPL